MAKARSGVRGRRKTKTNPSTPGSDIAGPGHNSHDEKVLTSDEQRKLFLTHRTTWNQWKAKRAVVDKIESDMKAALKNDGFSVKQMKIADQLADPKTETKVISEVDDRLRVARWIGHSLGSQLDLFETPDRTPSVDIAYDAGKMASMQNERASPSYAPGTEQHAAYMRGYHDHQRELAGGIKAPASAS